MFAVALIAHDAKKAEMLMLVKEYEESLSRLNLFATLNTGRLIEEGTGLSVTLLRRGVLGGEQEIGTLVANGVVKAVIFLRDVLTIKASEPDITALLRICDVCRVPLATNMATARALLHFIGENPAAMRSITNKPGCQDELSVSGAN